MPEVSTTEWHRSATWGGGGGGSSGIHGVGCPQIDLHAVVQLRLQLWLPLWAAARPCSGTHLLECHGWVEAPGGRAGVKGLGLVGLKP